MPGGPWDVTDYLELASDARGVKDLAERLRTSRPAGDVPDGPGAAYIYRQGIKSAMADERRSRWLTLRLAGRARTTAPILAQQLPLPEAKLLLDVGGGTGFFAIAYLQRHPQLRAIVLDLPEVIKITKEFAVACGVTDRLECQAADMFTEPLPRGADAILLSNVLHDWDVPQAWELIRRCADVLAPGGRLLVHDVFLHDELDGPLHLAIYSVILFYLTEGRAYSAAEYREWLVGAGLVPGPVIPTLVHCGALPAVKAPG